MRSGLLLLWQNTFMDSAVVTDGVAILATIIGAAQLWSSQRFQTQTKRIAALSDLKNALISTEMYIKSLERKHGTDDHMKAPSRDWETERELAKAWSIAALSSGHLSSSIARMANEKSGFWRDVSKWSRSDITRYGIAIEDARVKIEALEKG